MAIKIRLARAGSKKRPFYHIVAADTRMPRDGRFLERIGSYNPLLPKDSEERVRIDLARVQHWLDRGAQPTDRIARFLESAGVTPAKTRANPKKAEPGEKAQKRAEEREKRAAAAKEKAPEPAPEAAAEAAPEPASEDAAPETTAEETTAEETTADKTASEDKGQAAPKAASEDAKAE